MKGQRSEVGSRKSEISRAGLTIVRPGVCRECGCTQLQGCVDPDDGEGCSWLDDEQTRCSVCALLFARSLSFDWQPARGPMITGLMPLDAALELVIGEANAGFLVHVCCRCQDPELRMELTARGLPNVSHGYCPACLQALLAELGELKGAA